MIRPVPSSFLFSYYTDLTVDRFYAYNKFLYICHGLVYVFFLSIYIYIET
jgi:hypothetical protein